MKWMGLVVGIGCLALAACGSTPASSPLPLHVGGRTITDTSLDHHPLVYQWPGTYFEAGFSGDEIEIGRDPTNRWHVLVDGIIVAETSPKSATTTLLKLKTGGRHVVRLERANESQSGPGFFLEAPLVARRPLPAPAPRTRQIEFIGDSFTVGYGNTSPTRDCTNDEVWATTNTSKAFGPLIAKSFDADYQINAYSGRGMVRNYDGVLPNENLPSLYPFALFDGKSPVNASGWSPQIIVIGLGTNDFSTALHKDEKWANREALHADYVASYVRFVQTLRQSNAGAFFILLATDGMQGEFRAQVDRVIDTLRASGETRVGLVPMLGLSYSGCHAHPSVADDAAVAESVRAFINARPDIWTGPAAK